MPLFRQEAVNHQSERLTGEISLAQPLSIKFVTLLLVLIAAAVITFLFTAEYSRKETVRGFLMPNKGVIKAFASDGGTIEKLLVREGDFVQQGDSIAHLVSHQNNAEGVDLSIQISLFLKDQVALINDEMEQHETLRTQESANLDTRNVALENEKAALHRQFELAKTKLTLLQNQQNHFTKLNTQGFVSDLETEQQQQTLLNAHQEKENITRQLLQHETALTQNAFASNNLPQQYKLKISNLKRQHSALEQQLAQIQNNFRYTVIASHAGTVTGIQVVEGETLNTIKPLLHILPEGSELVAELLLPTRSAGQIEEGQLSRLRFDAFPYQRFGFIESTIVRIDKALITPNEVQLPVTLNEPVYRLRATLQKQTMNAFGKQLELKSGMLFEADIMLEKRSLIDWLLEPIYSLKGRIS
tara:strand:- start:1734 stop:2978 length:1245 start_codon:yes stop_codon:yes gene_type:complete